MPIVREASRLPTEYHEYGNLWAVETRWKNHGIAERLAKLVQPGDVLVGHSNGAALWLRAVRDFGAPAQGLVLLNPALKDDIEFPSGLKFVHIYYNDDDEAVPWARRSPHWLTDPLWGDMGSDGYKGRPNGAVSQFDCERTLGLPVLHGHSAIIEGHAARTWAQIWGQRIGDAVE